MGHARIKIKRRHSSILKGLYAFTTQFHLMLIAKIARKEKTLALLFGRLRYCRFLFDEEITKENYIRNWYLTRRSLDDLIVMYAISEPHSGAYTFKLLKKIVELYTCTEKNVKTELSDEKLNEEWLWMRRSLSVLLLQEPNEVTPYAKRYLAKIKEDEKSYFKIPYLKLLKTE
ncbi:hypothetical protein [Shewanella aestuarii]|uniref:Uncharacterized protein n=1 Tax=Shewanella aestuarii TaxID=1028752 RepID=A0A6G9QRD6_9GAMM|nr:hypothetical protein [Shewanella aestuarii]QIR16663.1 hypothetical protein HBH39_19510 [Shewanella aestuarii]